MWQSFGGAPAGSTLATYLRKYGDDLDIRVFERERFPRDPDKAWAWLAQGGFIDDDLTAGTGTLSLSAIRGLGEHMSPLDAGNPLGENNVFKVDTVNARFVQRALYETGRVRSYNALERNGKLLPLLGVFEILVGILQRDPRLPAMFQSLRALAQASNAADRFKEAVLDRVPVALEVLIAEGWIVPSFDPTLPLLKVPKGTSVMRAHGERNEALRAIC